MFLSGCRRTRPHVSFSHFRSFTVQIQNSCDQNQLEEEEEEGGNINNRSYWTKIIHKLCTIENNVDGALLLLERLRLKGYNPDSLNLSSIIHGLCKSGRFSDAHQRLLLSLVSDWIPDERTCNVLIACLLDADSPHDTLDVVRQIIVAKPSFVPSLINYNRLIDQLCSHSEPKEAHELFHDLQSRGHSPNAITYTSLINGFGKAGDLTTARHLFDEMIERGILPNSLTYSVLVRGVLRKRKIEEGRDLIRVLWKKMAEESDQSINNAAFANLIDGLCREGFFQEVFRIAEDLPQGECVCEEFAYGQIIDSLCKFGQNHGASRIVYIMKKKDLIPGLISYNSIIHGLSKDGGCMRAYQLFEEGIVFSYSPPEPTYKVLVEALCKESDLRKARNLFEFMLKKEENADKKRIYNIYLRALRFINNPSELLNVLVLMLENQCSPDIVTLNTIIDAFFKTGKVDEAMKVLNDMLSGKFCAPDVVTFTTIIGGLMKMGKVEEALNIFLRMKESYCIPTVVTYNVLLQGLVKSGKVIDAMEIFKSMELKEVRATSTTYTIIIEGLFLHDKIVDAKRFWDEVIWPSGIHDDFVYSAIVRGLCNLGKFDEACDFLYELVDWGITPKVVSYNILIDYACNLGLKKMAYQIINEMKKNGVFPDAVTWRILDKLHGKARNQCNVEVLRIDLKKEENENLLDSCKEKIDSSGKTIDKFPKEAIHNCPMEAFVDPYGITEHREIKKQKDKTLERVSASEGEKENLLNFDHLKKEPLSKVARRVFGLI